jgi:PAS domain S-box-containing protein
VTLVAPAPEPADERLEEIAKAMFELASLNFGPPMRCRGDGSLLDGVVGCINMLSEELQVHLEERANASRELEKRVLARTAELEASKERFRSLVENTKVVPWELDASLAVAYVAPQARVLFGDRASAFVGNSTMLESTHPSDRDRVRAALLRLTESEDEEATIDYRVVPGDGRTLDVRSIVSAHRGPGGALTLRGITIDMTQQRALETSLQHAQKLEAVGRLASGMAHEINTPIQFVGDNLAFLGDSFEDLRLLYARTAALLTPAQAAEARRFEEATKLDYLTKEVPEALAQSLAGVGHVADIVRAMKAFSHQERSGDKAPVDVHAALRAVIGIARNETKDVADVVLEVGDVPSVVAYGSSLSQVFLNLLVNAAHAVGSVVAKTGVRGSIHVRTQRDGDDVVFSIADTGGGIPDAIRERVFDPFFTTKDVGEGSGQGLSLARAIVVDRHGGTITFTSDAGRGTTFFVRLPIAGNAAAGAATSPAAHRTT